jgi:hypothetical protein
VIWKVAEDAFAGIVRVDGIPTSAGYCEANFTVKPEGVAALSVTVPVEVLPAYTRDGDREIPLV